MTHPNFVTNGASLEDCHTNFFALADLNRIKWRRYYSDTVLCYDPFEDSVLSSFSKCLAADVLCVWRRVASPIHDHHRHNLQDCQQHNYKKELWIFWYGEEPDLTGLISNELTADPEEGSWEKSGLSYECRTLLFKAFHNLIERSLLQKEFSRLGRWFVQPFDGRDQNARSSQLALSFNFFIHGESTVCTSIDVRQRLFVSHLTEQHVSIAQGSHAGLKVILSPFGLAGTLTGQSFKTTDSVTQRILNDWHQFYPVRSRYTKESHADSDVPLTVEVIVSGVRMKYPTCFVLVVENEVAATVKENNVNPHYAEGSNSNPPHHYPQHHPPNNQPPLHHHHHHPQKQHMSLLTPPTSPCDPSINSGGLHLSYKYVSHPTMSSENFRESNHPTSLEAKCQAYCRIKQATWQDSGLQNPHWQNPSDDQTADQNQGQWDFCDPTVLIECRCSRCKDKNKMSAAVPKTSSSSVASNATTSPATSVTGSNVNNAVPSSANQVRKSDKIKVPHKFKSSMPFHKRNAFTDPLVDFDSFVQQSSFCDSSSSGTTLLSGSCSMNFQFKGPNQPAAGVPAGLPLLHTSVAQPSMLGSPLPGTPSVDGLNSQLSSTEPAMPTLSPHPPLPKEEDHSVPPLESQDQATAAQSPAVNQESTSSELVSTAKEKTSTELLPSPFEANISSVPENIKSEESPVSQSNNWTTSSQQEDVKPNVSEISVQSTVSQQPPSTTSMTISTTNQSTSSTMSHSLKRPVLILSSHEEPQYDQIMDGLFYDYSHLNASMWESVPKKRRRQRCQDTELSDASGEHFSLRDGLSPMEMNNLLLSKTKDPYEYDESDEESPSSGFRIKNEVNVKEEEKIKEPGLPPTPEPQQVSSQVVAMVTESPIQDPPKTQTLQDQQPISSPLTPRNPNSSFLIKDDLQVTDRDLENIFEPSSSDDSADDLFQAPSTPTSSKLNGTMDDSFPAKCKSSSACTSGILGVAELTRMFPTPPSLEHNTAPSPSLCGTDLMNLEGGECYRERTEGFDGGCSPLYEPVKDWSYVYKLPLQHKFVGSQRYGPLTALPSSLQQPVSEEQIYKPSWQVPPPQSVPVQQPPCPVTLPSTQPQFPSQVERLLGSNNSQFMHDGDRIVPPGFPMDSSIDQRNLSVAFELQSPASSASSYLNKHLNSMDSNSAALPGPEAHGLLVNIIISDTMLNIFKDHNFGSCMLCVCNMNTKGADAGIYLPSNLIPSGTDEPQYKCTCGFSAVINRHQSHRSGIFYEDELDITGHHYESYFHRKSLLAIEGNPKKMLTLEGSMAYEELAAQMDHIPHIIVDLIKAQCSQLYSSFSLFYKSENLRHSEESSLQYNALEVSDCCEVCFLALDAGLQALDNMSARIDENLKSSCLHKWPYFSAKVPSSNLEVVRLLRSLQPMLQEAVQQRRHHRLWEVTYPVLGPLTWRQFHRLAGRGTEDQCDPQPIPSLSVGYDKDWLALSPFALKFWDKLLLEPYAHSRDVAYMVVAPDNDFVLSHVKSYFKELSTVYELCRLGRHCPIAKVIRDGIVRVGGPSNKKPNEEPVDEWFNLIGDGPIASRLKLYAQACRYQLAPRLSFPSVDSSLLEVPVLPKSPEKIPPASSPKPSASFHENPEKEQPNPKPAESENQPEITTTTATPDTPPAPSVPAATPAPPETADTEDSHQTPTIVIYIVEPFTYGTTDSDIYRLASLGLLRSYSQMLQCVPEHIRNSIQLQVITLDSILSLGCTEDTEKRQNQLRDLAFSVFSRCHHLQTHQSVAKSLTGFGPAAAQDMFLKSKDARNSAFSVLSSKPFTLAPQKDKQTELGEMFGDRREKSSILYCTYCLTEDQRWLVASCTNEKGDILETCCISTEIPNRTRRKKASVRKFALHKLLDFIVEVMSKGLHTWRLVISRLGRLGHLELRDWATLLSKKSLVRYSRQLRELCHQCSVLGPPDNPAILSACLVSLEPDCALRITSDQYTPDETVCSSCNSCSLSTPEDASCTHILVFPTSATTQSSQGTFQQEHIDPLAGPLGDDDIFQALNDDDITVGQDINDIFRWTESPTQSPGASPQRDSLSQPGSPSCGIGGRHSPFHHGGPNRGSGNLMMDGIEEPLQLLQQPLALGYYVSTAKTGALPKWFWSTCPHLQNMCPVFLKSALLIHSPSLQQNTDDLLHTNPHTRNCHPLDSNLTTDVLRYVLEGYNTLSWLSLDPVTYDRRSCLPVHIQILMQLYHAVEALV